MTPRRRNRPPMARLSAISLALVAAPLGCVMPNSSRPDPRPAINAIQAADPELKDAKLRVIADFESSEQVAIFSSSSTVTRPRRSTAIAGPGTGGASLELTFDSSNIAYWAAGDAAADSRLPRDWSTFQMLVMSVHVPRKTNALRIVVRGGGGASRAFVEERIPLRAGWNVVRLDCEQIGRSVDLTDVRQIEWSVASLREPTVVHIDDLVLVDNAETLLGSRDNSSGSLYVTHEGHRLHIGAVGRFELVFRRGLIAGWYDLQSDPARRQNLVGETMGPFPVLLPTDRPATLSFNLFDHWSVLGETPTIRQSLLEASEARAVVLGEWRWPAGEGADGPAITWRYTIYPSGRVFVRLVCPTQTATWRADDVGVVLLTTRGAGFDEPDAIGGERFALGLFPRSTGGASDLLVVVHQAGGGRFVPIRAAGQLDAGILLTGSLIAQPAQQWALLLQVWPSDIDSRLSAEPIARDYAQPGVLDVNWGDVVLTADGDLDNDGFNESEGVYVAAPKDGILRFTFNRDQRLRFEPTVKLVDTANKDIWVYADGRIVRDLSRDVDGNAVVRLADAVDHQLLVEVHCRDRAPGGAASGPEVGNAATR